MPVINMYTKSLLLVTYTLLQAVVSGYLAYQPPYRLISGFVQDISTPRTGKVQLAITGENITDIVTSANFTAGNISIDTEGGVGSDSVVFSYGVTPNAKGPFNTFIYTEEGEDSSYNCEELRHEAKSANESDIIFLTYYAEYNSSDTPRKDSVVLSFDRQIYHCFGYSSWLNGNGSRQLYGSYPQDHLDIVLDIPKGVSGTSSYTCVYRAEDLYSRRTMVPFPVSLGARDGTGLVQIYGTTDHSNTTHRSSMGYDFDYEIVSYEGIFELQNGTSNYTVSGGVGFKYIDFSFELAPYSYGILDYDVIVKLG